MRTVSVAAAALLAAQAITHPVVSTEKPNRIQRRMVDLNKFRLDTKPSYVKTDEIPSNINSINKRADYVSAAEEVVKKVAPSAEYRIVNDSYVGTNGIAHVHFKQTAHGLDIDNADFNVNIAKDGSVFSYGNSFFKGDIPAASPITKRDFVDPVAALKGVSNVLSLSVGTDGAKATAEGAKETYTIEGATQIHQAPQAKLVYFVKEDNTVALTWRVETDLYDDWLLSYIDAATSKEIQGVVNYKADAVYEVFPWGINDPDEGGRELITNPWDTTASEFTWQSDGTTTYDVTRGNNGIAQANYEGDSSYLNDYRPVAANSSFVYPLDLTATNPKTNVDASVTQLWYTANMYHDLLYDLGFTEQAGNFETNVDGQGGKGSDAVILNAQDGAGTDNADFSTPPDGQAGRMRMFIWDYTTPKRDCTFEAGVIIHEYTHGVSNRLTGGPANTACLNVLEAGGMGEGWGDFMATAIRTNTSDTRDTDYPLGAWVYGDPDGIRAYPYSTDINTNPLTYKSLNSLNEVHAIGTMWANTLYEVMWNLIDANGNTDAIRPTFGDAGVPTDGRYLAMKVVIDGMALQPCNPTMPQARDAIIDADTALTGGANTCALWTAFAKRGLGENASRGTSSNRQEDYTIPAGVC